MYALNIVPMYIYVQFFLFLCSSPFRRRDSLDLDHPADVQLHSWGKTLERAFELVAEAMFGYMGELDSVDLDDAQEATVEAEGHDLDSLLFNLLDELLFQFNTEGLV